MKLKKIIIAVAIILLLAGGTFLFLHLSSPSFDFLEGDIVISGIIVTPDKIINDGSVVIRGEVIVYAGKELSPNENIKFLDYGGYVFPGLVNAHDHIGWNFLPKWIPDKIFNNRYEWRKTQQNNRNTDIVYSVRGNDRTITSTFIKLRKIIGGTTSVQSSRYGGDPVVLTRSLNNPDEIKGYEVINDIFIGQTTGRSFTERRKIQEGQLAYCIHVSEGVDRESLQEFYNLKELGFISNGSLLIHGVPYGEKEFSFMAEKGASLGWSPKCNLILYRQTANAPLAKKTGVNIALTTDWSLQGSGVLLDELKFVSNLNKKAYDSFFSYKDLFDMCTVNPAKALGFENLIGALKEGAFADIILVNMEKTSDPYKTFSEIDMRQIELVLVGGKPMYGIKDYYGALNDGETIYTIEIFNETRMIRVDYNRILQRLKQIYPQHSPLIIKEDNSVEQYLNNETYSEFDKAA